MTCTISKEEILNIKRFSAYSDDPNINIQNPYDSCTYYDFMVKILINDFKNDLTNCIFRSECPNYDTMMIVMTVCYAYCLLKCCILLMVFFYQKNRVKNISNNIANIKNFDEDVQQHIQNNLQNKKNKGGKYYLDSESISELKTYENSIKMNITVEIIMALRDFLMFRGLGYFISYLYDVVFVYNQQLGEGNSYQSLIPESQYQCSIQNFTDFQCEQLKQQTRFYLSSADICVIRYPFFNFEGESQVDEQYSLMYIYIIVWIILESFSGSILFFNTQVLSYVNEGGKEPKEYNKNILLYSQIFFVCQALTLSALIFVFQIRLYFRFQSVEVIIFYLVWKSLGFMLLLDQFIKKSYLSKELYIDIAYDKEMNWKGNEKTNYENAIQRAEESDRSDRAIPRDFISNYKKYLEKIHNNLRSKCIQKDSQQNNKIQFQWHSYLKFVLFTLFLGILGYSSCLIHYSINKNSSQSNTLNDSYNIQDLNTPNFQFGKFLNAQSLYWFGFICCMLESAIFEIFNSVLLLHSYYLQLFKQMASPDDSSNSEENNQ